MNRREFLKKGLEGVVIGSILLISGCGKNHLESNMKEHSVKNLYLFFQFIDI